MTGHVRVVICEFGSPDDPWTDPTISGWTTCKCGRWVAMHGGETTQVQAGTLLPLCIVCADEIGMQHPEVFSPQNKEEGSAR